MTSAKLPVSMDQPATEARREVLVTVPNIIVWEARRVDLSSAITQGRRFLAGVGDLCSGIRAGMLARWRT